MAVPPIVYPATFPHDLSKKPHLKGEKLVYDFLTAVFDNSWTIFYDWPVRGTRRRIDFLCMSPMYGIVAFEVKGGLVHNYRGKFRQMVDRKTKRRKVITPFDQVKRGCAEIMSICEIDALTARELHLAIFYPEMMQTAFTFGKSAHIFTREDLEQDMFKQKLFG